MGEEPSRGYSPDRNPISPAMVQMRARAKSSLGPAGALAALMTALFAVLAVCLLVRRISPSSPDPAPDKGLRARTDAAGRVFTEDGAAPDVTDDDDMIRVYSADGVLEAGLPYLIYGTAWKKSRTADLVSRALYAGFRFVDTACQPKHYDERLVGEGWTSAASGLGIARDELFLQTKFTGVRGQDPEDVPYDPDAPLGEQVRQSVRASLRNLQVRLKGRGGCCVMMTVASFFDHSQPGSE